MFSEKDILMNNIRVVAGLLFLVGVLGQLVSAKSSNGGRKPAEPLPNVRSVSEHLVILDYVRSVSVWQELEEVNVDEVVESIMLHWRNQFVSASA